MKGSFRRLLKTFGTAAIILAALGMLFPRPTCVLCIAPGGHAAIEDIDSGCCASSVIPASAGSRQAREFDAAGKCRNCRDFLITPNGRGAVLKSAFNAPATSLHAEGLIDRLPTDLVFFMSFGTGAMSPTAAPIPVFSPPPLRC
jgi:hypothetical protein